MRPFTAELARQPEHACTCPFSQWRYVLCAEPHSIKVMEGRAAFMKLTLRVAYCVMKSMALTAMNDSRMEPNTCTVTRAAGCLIIQSGMALPRMSSLPSLLLWNGKAVPRQKPATSLPCPMVAFSRCGSCLASSDSVFGASPAACCPAHRMQPRSPREPLLGQDRAVCRWSAAGRSDKSLLWVPVTVADVRKAAAQAGRHVSTLAAAWQLSLDCG